jgi:hypothetical protein
MRYWYEGEVRGMDLEGFGRFYDGSEMFAGYMSLQHNNNDHSQYTVSTLGGAGVFMRTTPPINFNSQL